MNHPRFGISEAALAAFCARHRIRRLSLFGSVLRDDFGPGSDLDVLVEFEVGHRVGMFALVRMQQELTELAGRDVDLRTPAELSRYFRDDVLRKAQVAYAAG